ncbi:MAG TPA: choice-of-anchor Q domain-containing protein [Terracidiphilus sp.]|nr:choice-of-anchor Q domain-containing protein [Terracidiphilus sp.]
MSGSPASTFVPRPSSYLRAALLAGLAIAFLSTNAVAASAHYSGATFTISNNFVVPFGVAVDGAGDVFVSDNFSGTVSEIVAVNGQVSSTSTIVQIASGFNAPAGLALDAAGDLFVAETNNGAIREIVAVGGTVSPSSTIVTFGGPSDPTFFAPAAVAVDAAGNVYVTDVAYGTLSEILASGGTITPSSLVVTLAGDLKGPFGVAVDAAGDVFVSQENASSISEYVPTNGQILPGTNPTQIGSGLSGPAGIALDPAGDIFVASLGGFTVKEIVAGGATILTLGSNFGSPAGVAVGVTGNVYLTDSSDGVVDEINRQVLNFGNVAIDGFPVLSTVQFTFDSATTLDSWSVLTRGAINLDYFEFALGTTCSTTTAYQPGDTCSVGVEYAPLFAGPQMGSVQLVSGGAVIATANLMSVGIGPNPIYPLQTPHVLSNVFSSPAGIAIDGSGDAFVGDMNGADVKEIQAVGGVIPINPTVVPLGDGSFVAPSGVAVDGSGDLFVADSSTGTIVEMMAVNGQIPATPTIVTISSAFQTPEGIAIDRSGNLYVADALNSTISEIVAVNGQVSPSSLVVTLGSGFNQPYGVAVDTAGDVFVADGSNSAVKEIVAVNGQIPASPQIVTNSSFLFNAPSGVAVDAAGNVFVADQNNGAVYEIGADTSQPFSNWPVHQVSGPPSFAIPFQVALDPAGDLFVADRGTSAVSQIPFASPTPLVFLSATPVGTTDLTDGAESFTIANDGNAPLVLTAPLTGSNPNISADFSWDGSSTCPQAFPGILPEPELGANASCTVAIDFTPTDLGSISGSAVISYTPPNPVSPGSSVSMVNLTGTSTAGSFAKLVVSAPSTVVQGQAFTFTVTAEDSLGNTVTTFSDSIQFSSSDGTASLPGISGLTNGVGTFPATLNQSGGQSLSAIDLATSTGYQAIISVTAPQFLVVNVTTDDFPNPSNCTPQAAAGQNNTDTSPGCALRDALAEAATLAQANISFDSTAFASAQTITLTHGTTLNVPANTTITGPTSGSGGPVTIDGGSGTDGNFPVFTIGSGNTVTISNLTIQKGSNPGNGGGIANSGSLTLNNCTITANVAASGGGIESSGSLVINNSTISGNQANGPGAGLLIDGSSSTVNIANSTFSGNFSQGTGGGMDINAGTAVVTISGSTLSSNISGTVGGAVSIENGSLKITDSAIAANESNGDGGGVEVNNGTADIEYSTFLTNTTISGSGGAISVEAGTATVTNATISLNLANAANGGGIAVIGGTLTLANSIVAGNTAASDPDVVGAFDSAGAFNLIGDGTGMSGLSNGSQNNQVGSSGSPLVAGLTIVGNYGGPTQTLVPLPLSPAICTGGLGSIPPGVTVDQRGVANTNTTYGASTCVDIGAVETHYQISFTTEPPSSVAALPISPAPVVGLTENGLGVTASTGNVVLTDPSSALPASTTAPMSSGLATFSNLTLTTTVTNDTLNATYALGGAASVTAASNDFSYQPPVLAVSMSHSPATGFTQGSTGEWDITVSNTGTQPTSGTITVTDTLPTGGSPQWVYAPTSSTFTSGAFSCTTSSGPPPLTVTCTSSSAIAGGGNTAFAIVVSVPGNSTSLVSNSIQASGGGASNTATTSDTVPVTFTTILAAGNATTPQSATVKTPFTNNLVVHAGDVFNNNISGDSITWTASVHHGASGTFSNGTNTITVPTDGSGAADPGPFTANSKTGTYQVTATDGIASVTYTLTNVADSATGHLVLSDPDTSDGTWPIEFTGWPLPLKVAVLDQFGNRVASFADTLHFSSSDLSATLPADSTLSNGTSTFSVTFNAAGSQTITVTDLANLSLTATTSTIVVNATPNYVVTTASDDAATPSNCNPQATPGTGTDLACSLRDALAAAALFHAGNITFDSTAFSTGNTAAQNTILLTNGVLDIANDTSITGVFSGSGSTLTDNVTVNGHGTDGVFELIDPNEQGIINGLAITNGALSDSSPNAVVTGAGIDNDGTLTVTNCVISNNTVNASDPSASSGGGGIYNDGELTISSSILTGNSVSAGGAAAGGGILNYTGYLDASNIIVTGNTVTAPLDGGDAAGGGIFTDDSEISHSLISGNTATGVNDGTGTSEGGGLAVNAGTCIQYTTVANNLTSAGGMGTGGGIYTSGDECLYNDTVSNNQADGAGGLMLFGPTTLNIYNSIVSGNTLTAGGVGNPDFVSSGSGTFNDGGGNQINVAAINLAPLTDNGGLMQSMLPLPGSPAICDGLTANIAGLGTTTDVRGFPNTNTAYVPSVTCVDSGAVQTAYQIAFTIDPPSTVLTNQPISPAPAVVLTESLVIATAPTNNITMTDSSSALNASGATAALSVGSAIFSNLEFSSDATNDSLTATLALTSTINLTTTSGVQVTSVTPAAPTFIWSPPATIIVGDAGTSVLNASVSCSSCGTITYTATPTGGGAPAPITTTSGLSVGTYNIQAIFTPGSSYFLATSSTQQLTVSGQSVWVVNSGGGTSELAGNGAAISSGTYAGANAAVAIDATGNVWSVGTGAPLVEAINQVGAEQHAINSGGGLKAPAALAIDGNSQVWVANSGNNSISLFLDTGAAVSPSTGFTDSSLSAPSGIAVDLGGSVWVANKGNNSLTRVVGAAAPVAPLSTAAANNTTGARP